jgi:FkbH-like protein
MKELEYPFNSAYILQKKKYLRKILLEQSGLMEKNVAILCGSTVGVTKNILELFLLNQGVKPIFWEGQYDRYYEDIMFDDQELVSFRPDIVYIFTSVKNITDLPKPKDTHEAVTKKLESTFNRFKQIWDRIRTKLHCPIIQNNFEPLPYRILGNSDVYQTTGCMNFINKLNEKFNDFARENNDFYINDLNYEASWFGLARWFDFPMWYMYRYPFALDAIPLVCHNVANIIKSIFGKNKKAIILDLDNTLWGGIIGDDGALNIRLGAETAEGMAFYDFQEYLKALSELGVMLNVCSKNEENIAVQAFGHPSSILERDDFIIFKANWMNKDENIKSISTELNIIQDDIVFLDDNPAERDLVKRSIPQLQVPVLDAPENYVRILDQSGFFEATTISDDDKKRNKYYKSNKAREESINQFTDYHEYLKQLEMVCNIEPIKEYNIQRITQLINKTNQFNLTTKRYTQEEVLLYSLKPTGMVISARLTDKYGDNGIVSVLIAEERNEIIEIDLWVMSCRVFKRDLEKTIFDELIQQCQKKGINRIKGYYYKTKKNQLVEDLYQSFGFKAIEKNEDYGIWEYQIPTEYTKMNMVMEVKND